MVPPATTAATTAAATSSSQRAGGRRRGCSGCCGPVPNGSLGGGVAASGGVVGSGAVSPYHVGGGGGGRVGVCHPGVVWVISSSPCWSWPCGSTKPNLWLELNAAGRCARDPSCAAARRRRSLRRPGLRHADPAVVRRDDGGDDGQAETAAAACRARGRGRRGRSARTPGAPARVDAGPVVAHLERRRGRPPAADGDLDRRAGGRVVERVGDEVRDDLAQPALVARHPVGASWPSSRSR